ncbi:unnamed protein product [Bemisia tabaci]|uniref:Uncharacterized protein n=1 Tax=Bemisia tabaci TaxID=7038 RepID=A0A9P0A5T9_BEMTA|nr:unnamed protein product [Bemisia tabaci]
MTSILFEAMPIMDGIMSEVSRDPRSLFYIQSETYQEESEFDHPVKHHVKGHEDEEHYNSDDNHPSEHYVEDNQDEPYNSEAEAEISDENEQSHEFKTSPEPTLLDNEEDNFSEIETENYDFYPETRHVLVVRKEFHPELFGLHFAIRNHYLWHFCKSTFLRKETNGIYVVSKMSQKQWFLIAKCGPFDPDKFMDNFGSSKDDEFLPFLNMDPI